MLAGMRETTPRVSDAHRFRSKLVTAGRPLRQMLADGFRSASSVLALAVLCASPVVGAAGAAEGVDGIPLVKTAEPLVPATFARDLSVAGVKPGMTADEARREVRARYGDVAFNEADTNQVKVEYNGTALRSQPFVSVLQARPLPGHTLRIYLGPPSTGGVVIAVDWTVSDFAAPDKLSTVEQALAALHAQYGPESPGPRVANGDNSITEAFWTFDSRKLLPCQERGCMPASKVFGAIPPEYRPFIREGRYVILSAILIRSDKDPGRVGFTSIVIEDAGNKLLAQEEAAKQMRATADRHAGSPAKP